jgi:adenylate kinase family enzyme
MKYILIIGACNAGKSTTANAVCEKLNPSRILLLTPKWTDLPNSNFVQVDNSVIIENGTYIIEVNGKLILISAGSPTEQCIRISILIEICITLNLSIEFALVSMRSFEKKDGYDTRNELKKIGELILEKKIYRIKDEKFETTDAWKTRIDSIVKLIKKNIKEE